MSVNQNSCVAIGNFDGIHLGHDALINKMINISKCNGLNSVILTFKYVSPNMKKNSSKLKYITDFESKIELLKSYNTDVFIIELDEVTSKYSPEKFIEEILVKKFKAKHIVVGFNFRFGYMASGNIETLKLYEEKYNYKIDVLNPVQYKNMDVSSTRIRDLICSGRISEADELLKNDYTIFNRQLTWINNKTCIINHAQEIITPCQGIYNVKLGNIICKLNIKDKEKYKELSFDKEVDTTENIIFLNN